MSVLVDVTRFIACVTLVCVCWLMLLGLLLVLPWCVCVGEFPQFIACVTLVCVCVGGCYSVYCLCYLGVCVLVDVTRFIACVTLVCEVFVCVCVGEFPWFIACVTLVCVCWWMLLGLLLVLPWCVCVGGCYSVYCLCYLGV